MKAIFGFFSLPQIKYSALIPLFLLFVFPAQAEIMGMVPGRSADVSRFATKSVEVGASWYTNQLRWSALRYNFKPVRRLAIYLDFAHIEASNLPLDSAHSADFSGFGYGGGVMFSVPEKLNRFDIAFKGAFHSSKVAGQLDQRITLSEKLNLHQSQWSAGFVLSPIDPLYENGLTWYATLAYADAQALSERFGDQQAKAVKRIRYRRNKGMAVGAGMVKPFKQGSIYAGIDWLSDNALVGAGYRYKF